MTQECSIKEILEEIGYKLTNDSNGWRSSAIYRNGSNETSLLIRKDGSWHDFVECIGGKNIDSLIKKTLNFNDESLRNWLQNKQYSINKETFDSDKHKIKMTKVFDEKLLLELIPDFSFYEARGIKPETLRLLKAGLATKGKLKNRVVFPIFNSKNEIVGFSGRSIEKDNLIKWKIISHKSEFIYPAFLTKDYIKSSQTVYLVESIGDFLGLWTAGIKNVLVLFGLELSLSILNYLLRINIQKIIISTNNDENGRGNEAAEKLYRKLCKYFDSGQIEIRLPNGAKDWGEILIKDGPQEIVEQLCG